MTGIIILAAGASRRFGSPKQLAHYQGQPLLGRAAETALDSKLGPVRVVLGAVDGPCREMLKDLEVEVIFNPDWEQGMSGSIVAGLQSWQESTLSGVLLMVADQPTVTAPHLRRLIDCSRTHSIAASAYSGQLGVPAWFSSTRFPDLMSLQGEKGAKPLFDGRYDVAAIPFPDAALDVDTPADLLHVRRSAITLKQRRQPSPGELLLQNL